MRSKCPNIGNCDKADKKELISIPDGADLICPECGAQLIVIPDNGRWIRKISAAVATVIVLGLGWFLWPEPDQHRRRI